MGVTRRGFFKAAGVSTVAAGLQLGSSVAPLVAAQPLDSNFPIPPGGRKPVFTPPPGEMDPAVHSVSDTLFWSDIMAEHSLFFAMMLPGAEAAPFRQQALAHHQAFQDHFLRVMNASIDRSNFQELNRQTVELVRPLIDFKFRLEELQGTGQARTLVWASFAAHTRAEAERFAARLERYAGGNVEFDLAELSQFWTRIMGEHALFVAGLLDQVTEHALIEQARTAGQTFLALRDARVTDFGTLLASADEIIAFKETAEAGIEAGQIQSIIHPVLADHVRREAVKFRDELLRASQVRGVQVTGPVPSPVQAPR